jgi:hypothetical protein
MLVAKGLAEAGWPNGDVVRLVAKGLALTDGCGANGDAVMFVANGLALAREKEKVKIKK